MYSMGSITVNVERVDMGPVAKLFNNKVVEEQIKRPEGQVDMLIGIHAATLFPIMKNSEKDIVGDLRLLNTTFGTGWLVDGRHPEVVPTRTRMRSHDVHSRIDVEETARRTSMMSMNHERSAKDSRSTDEMQRSANHDEGQLVTTGLEEGGVDFNPEQEIEKLDPGLRVVDSEADLDSLIVPDTAVVTKQERESTLQKMVKTLLERIKPLLDELAKETAARLLGRTPGAAVKDHDDLKGQRFRAGNHLRKLLDEWWKLWKNQGSASLLPLSHLKKGGIYANIEVGDARLLNNNNVVFGTCRLCYALRNEVSRDGFRGGTQSGWQEEQLGPRTEIEVSVQCWEHAAPGCIRPPPSRTRTR